MFVVAAICLCKVISASRLDSECGHQDVDEPQVFQHAQLPVHESIFFLTWTHQYHSNCSWLSAASMPSMEVTVRSCTSSMYFAM